MRDVPRMVIILLKDSGTHLDCCLAAALAARELLPADFYQLSTDPWSSWLDPDCGNEGKLVKRVGGAHLQRILDEVKGAVRIKVGDAVAVAVPPCLLTDMHPLVRKAQLDGTDRRHVRGFTASYDHLDKASLDAQPDQMLAAQIRSDLGMSTGKAAAQTAHVLCRAALANPSTRTLPTMLTDVFVEEMEHFLLAHPEAVFVHDAGYTEIPAGSLTAACAVVANPIGAGVWDAIGV